MGDVPSSTISRSAALSRASLTIDSNVLKADQGVGGLASR